MTVRLIHVSDPGPAARTAKNDPTGPGLPNPSDEYPRRTPMVGAPAYPDIPSTKRAWPYAWQHVPGVEGEILTRGRIDGLPVLSWGWADPTIWDTVRGLRRRGLRPGGQDPVALLLFQHHKEGCRKLELANLYLVAPALPKRTATPAQRAAIGRALAARRTCRACGQVRDYYLSTISRLCVECEDATGFWAAYAAERGYPWEVAA